MLSDMKVTDPVPSGGSARSRLSVARTLFRVVLVTTAVVTSWLGWHVHQHNQRVHHIRQLSSFGGGVKYSYEMDAAGNYCRGNHPDAPNWLRGLIGDEYFGDVVCVDFSSTGLRDSDLAQVTNSLAGIGPVQWVDLRDTQVTDAGLAYLHSLQGLKGVWLFRAPVTSAGLATLRRSIPHLHIGL